MAKLWQAVIWHCDESVGRLPSANLLISETAFSPAPCLSLGIVGFIKGLFINYRWYYSDINFCLENEVLATKNSITKQLIDYAFSIYYTYIWEISMLINIYLILSLQILLNRMVGFKWLDSITVIKTKFWTAALKILF